MLKKNDRIRILYMKDDPAWNNTIHYGDEDFVESIVRVEMFKETQIWVKLDKGSYLALLEGIDRFVVIEEKPIIN